MPDEIVKVQRPLATTRDGPELVLIYDKARKHMTEQPLSAIVRERMGADMKAYFLAVWDKEMGWGLSDRVENRRW